MCIFISSSCQESTKITMVTLWAQAACEKYPLRDSFTAFSLQSRSTRYLSRLDNKVRHQVALLVSSSYTFVKLITGGKVMNETLVAGCLDSAPVDVRAVSEMLCVSKTTLLKWRKRGLLPRCDVHGNAPRWRLGTIRAWLHSGAAFPAWVLEHRVAPADHKRRWRGEVEELRKRNRGEAAPAPVAPCDVIVRRKAK